MKKIFTLLVALVATTALWAYAFKVDGIYYNILADKTNEVEVSQCPTDYSGSVTIPETVTHYGITYSVTSIGYGVFGSCSGLTSVTIPNSVTSIGDWAFRYCSGLTSVTLGNSVTSIGDGAFYICEGLTSVTIPNSVTSIGDEAFARCSGLTSVTIGNSVTSIGDRAFGECTGLTSPVYNAHCFAYMPTSYGGAYAIPEGIKQIAGGAFYGCSGLTSITIPKSVTSIGNYAFEGCSGLTSITIPNNVTSIGNYAFRSCSDLTSITIPNSVTSIGERAFNGCESLTSVTIGNSVTSIGNYVFSACSGLKSIRVEDGNAKYDSRENCNAIIETNSNTLVAGCKNTTIPNSVTSIGRSAFSNCSSLTSITIPNSVTSIGEYTFFYCSGLTSITIPNSVTSIGEYAFYYCSGLTSVYVWAEVPPTLGTDAFYNVSKQIPVYVPCGSVSAYQSAEGWKNFTNIQEPLAEYSIIVSVNDTIMGTAKVDYNNFYEGNQISATPNFGYHFVQWSDGNTDNPRTLVLTQDTTLTAEFAQTYSGQCGDNLYWAYDENNKTISITGSGDMYDYSVDTVPWLLFKEQIMEVTTSNTATSIGTSAFEGCIRLAKLSLGTAMEHIAANAFANCRRLYEIYSYASLPPLAETSSFTNYNATLYVPCKHKQYYQSDMVFILFIKIECIGAESDETDGDNVTITPGSNDVTITWPTGPNAETYVIVIKQGDKVFCTLTFNKDGMLTNIAFAPSRSGSHPVTYAASTGNGLRFTVTSLDAATTYAYDITTKDVDDNTISTYTGEFTTKSNVSTSVSDIQSPMTDCQKFLRNGQLVIVRDGVEYNAMGTLLD